MEVLNTVEISVLRNEINNVYNLLISDDYVIAKFTCDKNGCIISPGCISSKVHIHHEQNLVALRQLKASVYTESASDDEFNYLLPGKNCQIEVIDELKIYNPLLITNGNSNETASAMLEYIYVDESDYETIDGSRTEFVKSRIEIFNNIIKNHQNSLSKHNK